MKSVIIALLVLSACASGRGLVSKTNTQTYDPGSFQLTKVLGTVGDTATGEGAISNDGIYIAVPVRNSPTAPKLAGFSTIEVFDITTGKLVATIVDNDAEKYSGGVLNIDAPFVTADGDLAVVNAHRRPDNGLNICIRKFEFSSGAELANMCAPESKELGWLVVVQDRVVSPDGRYVLIQGASRIEPGPGTDFLGSTHIVFDVETAEIVAYRNTLLDPGHRTFSDAVFGAGEPSSQLFFGSKKRFYSGANKNGDQPSFSYLGFTKINNAEIVVGTFTGLECMQNGYRFLDSNKIGNVAWYVARESSGGIGRCRSDADRISIFKWPTADGASRPELVEGDVPIYGAVDSATGVKLAPIGKFLGDDMFLQTYWITDAKSGLRRSETAVHRVKNTSFAGVSQRVSGTVTATWESGSRKVFVTREDEGKSISLRVFERVN